MFDKFKKASTDSKGIVGLTPKLKFDIENQIKIAKRDGLDRAGARKRAEVVALSDRKMLYAEIEYIDKMLDKHYVIKKVGIR